MARDDIPVNVPTSTATFAPTSLVRNVRNAPWSGPTCISASSARWVCVSSIRSRITGRRGAGADDVRVQVVGTIDRELAVGRSDTPKVGDPDAELGEQSAKQGQRQADDGAVVALDPLHERPAPPVDRERAGDAQRLAGRDVGVDLLVGQVGEVDDRRAVRSTVRPVRVSIRWWPVCSTPERPRICCQRAVALRVGRLAEDLAVERQHPVAAEHERRGGGLLGDRGRLEPRQRQAEDLGRSSSTIDSSTPLTTTWASMPADLRRARRAGLAEANTSCTFRTIPTLLARPCAGGRAPATRSRPRPRRSRRARRGRSTTPGFAVAFWRNGGRCGY